MFNSSLHFIFIFSFQFQSWCTIEHLFTFYSKLFYLHFLNVCSYFSVSWRQYWLLEKLNYSCQVGWCLGLTVRRSWVLLISCVGFLRVLRFPHNQKHVFQNSGWLIKFRLSLNSSDHDVIKSILIRVSFWHWVVPGQTFCHTQGEL